jgi:hypothetical protein
MANAMYGKFDKYWAEPNVVLLIAAVFDPSIKTTFIRFYFHIISMQMSKKK